ncbi:MAG: hypothetical protein ACKOKC_10795, partial [Chthoniobacterales bacterium]
GSASIAFSISCTVLMTTFLKPAVHRRNSGVIRERPEDQTSHGLTRIKGRIKKPNQLTLAGLVLSGSDFLRRCQAAQNHPLSSVLIRVYPWLNFCRFLSATRPSNPEVRLAPRPSPW